MKKIKIQDYTKKCFKAVFQGGSNLKGKKVTHPALAVLEKCRIAEIGLFIKGSAAIFALGRCYHRPQPKIDIETWITG